MPIVRGDLSDWLESMEHLGARDNTLLRRLHGRDVGEETLDTPHTCNYVETPEAGRRQARYNCLHWEEGIPSQRACMRQRLIVAISVCRSLVAGTFFLL